MESPACLNVSHQYTSAPSKLSSLTCEQRSTLRQSRQRRISMTSSSGKRRSPDEECAIPREQVTMNANTVDGRLCRAACRGERRELVVRLSPTTDRRLPCSSIGRGRRILAFLDLCSLFILNGCPTLHPSTSSYTSFQPGGNSVIDYAIASQSTIPFIHNFNILSKPPSDITDHAALILTFSV